LRDEPPVTQISQFVHTFLDNPAVNFCCCSSIYNQNFNLFISFITASYHITHHTFVHKSFPSLYCLSVTCNHVVNFWFSDSFHIVLNTACNFFHPILVQVVSEMVVVVVVIVESGVSVTTVDDSVVCLLNNFVLIQFV